jgi:hypothetical protein
LLAETGRIRHRPLQGGLGTKIHHACDGKAGRWRRFLAQNRAATRPCSPGYGGGTGPSPRRRPRPNRPYAVLGDKAHSSRANGSLLSGRGIKTAGILPVGDSGSRGMPSRVNSGGRNAGSRGEPRLELLFVRIVQH